MPLWLILFQRIGVSLGPLQLPLTLPVAMAVIAFAFAEGVLVIKPTRAVGFAFVLAACITASLLAVHPSTTAYSFLSLTYLLAIYWVFAFSLAPSHRDLYVKLMDTLVRVMCAVTLLGLAQFAVQLVGVPFLDPLGTVPSQFEPPGNYESARPVGYESAYFKPNAFLFIEPSFFSQFAALAFVVAIFRNARLSVILLLLAGVIVSLSGSGLVLLGIGTIVLLVTGDLTVRLVPFALALVALSFIVPAFQSQTWSRLDEFTQPGRSAHSRFVEPYRQILERAWAGNSQWIVGFGPGSVERVLGVEAEGGEAVVYPSVVKAVFEYGLVVGLALVLFVAGIFIGSSPHLAIGITVAVMFLIVAGSLLEPHTAFLAWAVSAISVAPRARIVPSHSH